MRSQQRRKVGLWLAAAILVMLAALAIAAGPRVYKTALVGSGFSAQILCGGIFISGRGEADIRAHDLSGPGYALLRFFRPRVEHDEKRVTVSLFGLASQTAIFRDGFGCTLLDGKTEHELRATVPRLPPIPPSANADALWPEGEQVDLTPEAGVDAAALKAAIDATFTEDSARPSNTRALVVVHHGRIVAEHYAPGFDANMPLIGWSMTKAALNALIGLRVKDGNLAVTDKSLLPEWWRAGDARGEISIDDLLRMSSGLEFDESYDDPLADVVEMLFVAGDKAKFAASKPLVHRPGTYWHYSSGTSIVLARVLRDSFASEEDYLRYPRERLFGPLGMRSAVLAPDAAGTLVASSFLYATARDFARLGLLFLQDGVWQGERLLPEDWIVYSRGPSRALRDGAYGAQIWLRLPDSAHLGVPPMPEDAYYFLGHEEQIVAIVPSRDLVIVRLGLTQVRGAWDSALKLAPIVQAFPPFRPPQ
jgi:CubicO group peptidase (beta-lactamase class C family)